MKKSIVLLTLLVAMPAHAANEVVYAGTEGLEHIALELREALGDAWQNHKVRNIALVAGMLAGTAYLMHRSKQPDKSRSPARVRYAPLMERKAEITRKRDRDIESMRTSLGIDEEYPGREAQTRGFDLSQLNSLVPSMLFAQNKSGDDVNDDIKISSSFAQGALIGSMASALLIVTAYGKPIKNGMLVEKFRSLFPRDLLSQETLDKLWFLGWPVKAIKILVAFW